MNPVTVSVEEAARALGLGRTTIYKLINEKRLESKVIAGRRLITVKSIYSLIATE